MLIWYSITDATEQNSGKLRIIKQFVASKRYSYEETTICDHVNDTTAHTSALRVLYENERYEINMKIYGTKLLPYSCELMPYM